MEQNCNVGAKNTGQACVPIIRVQKKLVAVQTYDSTGVLNELDLTAGPFNKTFFDTLTNHPDPSKRWYPLPEMKNISDVRADSYFKEFDDGSKIFINQGIRSFMGLIVASDAPPQMVDKIIGFRGIGMSIYAIDKEGNLIGKEGSSSTKFAPIELESDTIDALFVKTIDQDIQQIKVSFDVNINESDSKIRIIQSSELAYNLSQLRGMIDVTSVITGISTTGFTAKLITDGGTMINPVLHRGLTSADFVSSTTGVISKLRNVTDGSDVTITSVVESPAGVYTFAFVAQTSGDVLVLKPVKIGFDETEVIANTILIP